MVKMYTFVVRMLFFGHDRHARLLFFFFCLSRVSARIWGFRNWGGPSKRPPKIFFLPAIAVVARFARASLQATEWRGEGCDNRGSLLLDSKDKSALPALAQLFCARLFSTRLDSRAKLHSCVVW